MVNTVLWVSQNHAKVHLYSEINKWQMSNMHFLVMDALDRFAKHERSLTLSLPRVLKIRIQDKSHFVNR